jgi:VanZ family protein
LSAGRGRILAGWIPAIIWLCVITLESTELGAGENTSRILYPLLHFLFNLDPIRFAVWHFYIRKTGHFAGYAILSWLLFRAWRATWPFAGAGAWSFHWARISFCMSALVASLDEWHQTFIPTRTGRWQDIVLDSLAALCMQVFLWMVLRRRHSPFIDPDQAPAAI